ncbi:PAS domain S-box protein [Sphingopyxis sp. KK2]|uniref:PAS domain S-box protein n=1 Tax=Sphingopyxis sp. KK2 TaxID=1855727 RepID=UPI0011818F36|nr:PAS domain S-box protein [Sphingopyxis sp. KK2]
MRYALRMGGANFDLADLIPDSVVVRNEDGSICSWNEGAHLLYGWTADQAIGRDADDLLGSNHQFGLAYIMDLATRDGHWHGEIYRRAADGRELCVQVRWVVRRDDNGDIAEIVEWGRDTQEVSVGEVAAHRFTNLFHAMAASFWELDFSEVRKAVGALVADGITDIPAYLLSNKEFIGRAISMVRVIDVNKQTLELYRIPSREAVLSQPMDWTWPEESRHVFAESLVAAAQRRDRYSVETVLKKWGGEEFEVLFTVCWPSDHKAQGTVLVGIVDITDRKRAERELRASLDRYRDLFHHVPVALLQLDMRPLFARLQELQHGGVADLAAFVEDTPEFLDEVLTLPLIEEANAEALRLFRATEVSDLKGPISWAWAQSPETIRRSLLARLRGEPQYSEETRVSRPDGSVVDVIYVMSFPKALMDHGINVVGFVDMSARREADLALRQSEHRYRDLFHHLPLALWQCDTSRLAPMLDELRDMGITDLPSYIDAAPDFLTRCMQVVTIQEVNAATVALCGARSAEEFVGKTPWDYWRGNAGTFRRAVEARFAGRPAHSEETRMRLPSGDYADVAFSIAFPPALQDHGITVVATLDIGDRKRAEARLREVQTNLSHAARVSTLGELTASIAHEVNQPLAAITAFGEASLRWLQRDVPELEEVEAMTREIISDARRASDIIARIRGMALKRDPVPTPLDVGEVIDEALLIIRHESQSKAVAIEVDIAAALPRVMADRVQLQQVIVNLAVNALQAMSLNDAKARTLKITAAPGDGTVEICVDDSGPGVAAEHLDQLFNGFFTTKQEGMGMGLAICRSIIQEHGGRITAANHAEGARFCFTLPALGAPS